MQPLIALIDDRDDQRGTLRGHIEEVLPAGWRIRDMAPHESVEDAVAWVLAEKVAVLLLDERLDEAPESQSTYTGHELAKALREHRPELPIFIITSWGGDDALAAAAGTLDNIVQRKDFGKEAEVHVARFVRAGQRFVETNTSHLAELSLLAEAIATGQATAAQRKRAHALQTAMDVSAAFDPFALQADALKELEALTLAAEKLVAELAAPAPRTRRRKPATGTRRGGRRSK